MSLSKDPQLKFVLRKGVYADVMAAVAVVVEVKVIPGADKVEAVVVNIGDGTKQVVVNKGLFVQDEKVVFLDVDTVPPDVEAFRYLWVHGTFNLFTDAKAGTIVMHKTKTWKGRVIGHEVSSLGGGWARVDALTVEVLPHPLYGGASGTTQTWQAEDITLPQPSNFRVRPRVILNVPSEGLLFKLSIIRDANPTTSYNKTFGERWGELEVGDNVTRLLSIRGHKARPRKVIMRERRGQMVQVPPEWVGKVPTKKTMRDRNEIKRRTRKGP